eukprot:1168444-Ditylum_brightwellii.AAC.1
MAYTEDYPSNAMESDWNLVRQISETLKLLPLVSVAHIKGHQDNNIEYDDLEWKSHQNVDVDFLAGQFIDEHLMYRYLVHWAVTNLAQVHIKDITNNTRYAAIITRMATFDPLFEYIKERHGCLEDQMQSISWDA